MKKKEWKRLAKNAELRAAGVTVRIVCHAHGGTTSAQVIQRGTIAQIPVQLGPDVPPVLFEIQVA